MTLGLVVFYQASVLWEGVLPFDCIWVFRSEQICLEATVCQPFSLFIAWMSHIMEVKHYSIVARVIHTTLCSSHSVLHLLNSWVALVHLRQGNSLSVLLHFIHPFSSELESLECPPQALSGPGEDDSELPISPALHCSQAPLYSMKPAPSWEAHWCPAWVDCSLLDRGGEGWSEWGCPIPTPGHWAWPSRCKHSALLSPWVGKLRTPGSHGECLRGIKN